MEECKDCKRIEEKIKTIRRSLVKDFGSLLGWHEYSHAERRGAERFLAQKYEYLLRDVFTEDLPC